MSRLLPGPLTGVYRNAPTSRTPDAGTAFVVNGWLGDEPPTVTGDVLFAGVFLGRRVPAQLAWLNRSTRAVGSRDPFTHRLFAAAGIRSECIGCATLTLPRYAGPRRGHVAVDLRVPGVSSFTNAIPAEMPWQEQWAAALERLEALRTAAVVYTSRLHVVLPCLALGTPVVLPRRAVERVGQPARFSILDEVGFRFDEPFTADVAPLAQRFQRFLAAGLGMGIEPHDYQMPVPAGPPPAAVAPGAADAVAVRPVTASPAEGNVAEAQALPARGIRAEDQPAGHRPLATAPRDSDALHALGLRLLAQGHAGEALRALAQAVSGSPARREFRVDLAAALGRLGRHREAAEQSLWVVTHYPESAEAWHNLGVAREMLNELRAAADAYRAALGVRPQWPLVRTRLAGVLRRTGRYAEAEATFRDSILQDPDQPASWSGLAATLEDSARSGEALLCLRQMVDLLPTSPVVHSNLLIAMHYLENVDPAAAFDEHLRWADRHARLSYPASARAFANLQSPVGRKLRIGYVSPDFRDYPAPRFFEPLLAHHDRAAFEVFCYSDVPPARCDATTQRCQEYGHAWRDIAGLPDERVEQIVGNDRIDILVDLAGHMANPRLTLFARRAAPVQVSYIGYPATTGLATMDYRLTDAINDPHGEADRWHTEKLVRLDGCCWCFRPDDDAPPVGPLPALASGGRVTFAAFNRLAKVSPRALGLWARVLAATPESRLMVLVPTGAEDDPGWREQFARHGISGERLVAVGQRPQADYLRLWNEADVALDTFPYNGMTTTCDGLWMGVPTVTLVGDRHVARVGASLLAAVGLGELAAGDEDRFVAAVASLATDLPRLAELRAELRARVAASSLCDGPGLARRAEAAYRQMWAKWIAMSA